jgi:hypothetical protein
MTPLEREIEIIKLEESKKHLGMGNVAQLSYEDRIVSMAQYRLNVREIDNQITNLRNAG